MNKNNTALSLALILSCAAPALAMDPGFGPESFGDLAHKPSDEEKVRTYLYIPYESNTLQSDDEKSDNFGVQAVDKIIEEQSEVKGIVPAPKKVDASISEYEADLSARKNNLKPVAKKEDQTAPTEPQDSPETKELLAVQQETQEQMMQNELDGSHNSSPEPHQALMQEVEPLIGQVAAEQAPASPVTEQLPVERAQSVGEQSGHVETKSVRVGSAARFFDPALRMVKQAPDYYTAKYLAKDGTYDLSKVTILAHKRDLAYTVTLYAATVAALGGIVWGVVKLFKKSPKATQEEPAVKEVPTEPKKQQFKRPNPEMTVNLN